VRHRKANTMISLICEIKKSRIHRNAVEQWMLRGGRDRDMLVKGYKISYIYIYIWSHYAAHVGLELTM
jgi:type IV secretory pathway TrbD component